jgi:uncharacterized coiled-coil DUF342 family protein
MATPEEIQKLKDQIEEANKKLKETTNLGYDIAGAFTKANNDVNELKKILDAINKELDSTKTTFADLSKIFKNTLDDLKGFDSTSSSINKSFRTLGGLADKLRYDSEGITDLSKKELINLQTRAKIEVSNLKTQRQALDAQFKGKDLDSIRLQAQDDEDKGLLRKLDQYNELIGIIDEEGNLIKDNNNYIIEFNRLLDERLQKEKEYEKSAGGIASGLLKGLGKIPIIGDMLDIEGAQKAMRDTFDNGKGGFEQLTSGASVLGDSLMEAMGPLALIMLAVKAIKALVGAMFEVDKQVTSLAKNLSISKDDAQDMRKYFAEMSNDVKTQYNLTKDLIEAQIQLSNLSKFTILFSQETLDNQIALTKEIGLSEDEASNLNKSFSLNNVEGNKGRRIVYDRIAAFANENKIIANGKKILQDVSKVSGQILLNFRGNLPALTDAVLQAAKLGINLEDARNISNSLLDFESSITNELEAGIFLGRRFNLEQARALALRKDYVGATQEILKQVGSIEEFESMSAIHQQVIAKAANMTVDQLSESLMYQKFIGTETGRTIDRFKEAGKTELASRLIAGKLSGEELDKAQRSLDAQEKFNIALDKAKEAFTNIVSSGTLDSIVDALKEIANYVASITGNKGRLNVNAAQSISESAKEELKKTEQTQSLEEKKLTKSSLVSQKQSLEDIAKDETDVFDFFWEIKHAFKALKFTFGDINDKAEALSEVAKLNVAAQAAKASLQQINPAIDKLSKEIKEATPTTPQVKDGTLKVETPQKVQDGYSDSSDGPFEIKNKYGETAITAVGDKLAVGPNINTRPSSPSLDLTPFINAFNDFKNDVINVINKPQPAPTFVFEGNGAQLGKFIGSQIETGTAQNISTGYKVA